MRLFRRKQDQDDAPPDPEGPASGAPAAGADDDVARQPKQPTGDWMTLPPLAPSFAPMPTTFRVQTLPEILTSHADTRLSSSLGHAVSPDAPSGSVGGLATAHAAAVPHAGDISRSSSLGELPLREPHHPAAPAEPPIEVRRLADASAPSSPGTPVASTATSISTADPTPLVARLPEPTVSRSLLDTAPLAARPAGERPLPVARVVDAPAASASTAAPAPASAAPGSAGPEPSLSAEPGPADAPLVHDDPRVGGFGIDVDGTPTTPIPDDVPRSAPPAELAPPIQARRLQRRADPTTPAPTPPSAPLVGADAPATATDPLAERTPSSAPGGGPLPLVSRSIASPADGPSPAPTAPARPAADGGATDGPEDLPVARLAESAPPAATSAPLAGDRPLATPAAPSGTAEAPASAPPSVALPLHAPATTGPSAPASIEPPSQRLADMGTPSAAPTPSDAGASASLVGESPLTSSLADAADRHDDEPAPDRGATELPLVAPRSDAGDAGDDGADLRSVPTAGASPDPMVSVQPLADTASAATPAPSPGTAGLPLAPTDLGPSLKPPVTPARQDAPPVTEASSAPTARPLSTPAADAAGGPSLQRSPSAAPSGTSSGAMPFVRPVAASAAALAVQRAVSGAAPIAQLAPAPSAVVDTAVPVQLRRVDEGDLGSGIATVESLAVARASSGEAAPPSSGLPLAAPVQRLAGPSGPAAPSSSATALHPEGRPSTPELPLHTPATAIPSATDVAVRAGLAERGPSGQLFYTSPPATFVQRQAESSSAPTTNHADSGSGGGIISLQREPMAAASASALRSSSAASPSVERASGGGGEDGEKDAVADAKKLAADAKKLYPFIRSALEADIRRQLEGKSRASRFRP